MIELRYNKDGKLEYRTRILGYIAEGISDGWNEWVIVPSEEKSPVSSDFSEFLQKASEIVEKWPEWKKNVLGQIKPLFDEKQESPVEKNATPTSPSLRTERVVLDVTYDENTQGYPTTWDWSTMVLNDGESVRVIDKLELHCEYNEIDSQIEKLTGERDAAKARETIVRDRMQFWFEQYELREEALKKQDARVAQLEALLESEMWGVNCKPSASNAEPVAWGVMTKSESPQVVVGNPSPWKHMYLYFLKRDADKWRSMHGGTVFPLYAAPWLTLEQRRALTRAFDLLCDDDGDNSFADTVQKMLTANVNFLFLDEKETK